MLVILPLYLLYIYESHDNSDDAGKCIKYFIALNLSDKCENKYFTLF
jgi:hypothetical protein